MKAKIILFRTGLLLLGICIYQTPRLVAKEIQIPQQVVSVIKSSCVDCHGAETQEANIRLDNINTLDHPQQLALLNRVEEQLFFELMPPEDAEPLIAKQQETLSNWVSQTLELNNASKLKEKLTYPDYGNYIDHEKLFNGEIKDQPSTPGRRWLVSPQIFHERVNAVFKLTENKRQRTFYGVTNPIILPDHSGVRYYDTAALDGGHLLIMLNNAQWISEKQILGAINQTLKRSSIVIDNPKDRWIPPSAPQAFIDIVAKDSAPDKTELIAAIVAQFDCVLQREPSELELQKYLELLTHTIEVGGNEEGLRQMLVSVLLESEFLYRLEFGAGEADKFGRKKLSPREASYAIAYALSDQIPDQLLVAAANEGRLNTKEDYKREVLRLLNDEKIFYGEAAPHVNSLHMKSIKVTHPKINRFFREFFGYANSVKVFKDVPRSGGFYSNPGRGNTGTPGSVTNEADKIVDYVLQQDQDVFETLLTTDKYFVLHRFSNEEGPKIVANWQKVYEEFKDLDWQSDTTQFILDNFEKHKELFKFIKITKIDGRNNVRDFTRFMIYFEETFGKGITPFTNPWFYHGGQNFGYAEIYSVPGIPGFRGYDETKNWDYPLIQPFKLANRKGLLTHPAWLLAHSQNAETDPVRRGKWIREKLLAGRVPDVPITVDAQIPEDHHKTLRERLDLVTNKQECWKCHQQMNPLGLPFEQFDDFGRFRTEESLEHPDNLLKKGDGKTTADVFKTKPVVSTGYLKGTDDPDLDGEVTDAFDLIDRLAKSERVRQSIIRHAFRYFLGRNEMLSDSQTLINADQAYVQSGGSFKAVIVSLLTSDSFMYRK